jgi:CRISPR type I-E-associated protein CasB/Cse2
MGPVYGAKAEQAASTIALAAHVRGRGNYSRLGKALAAEQVEKRRVEALLRAEARDEMYRQARRLLQRVEQTAPIQDLIRKTWFWGEQARQQLAQEYFWELTSTQEKG